MKNPSRNTRRDALKALSVGAASTLIAAGTVEATKATPSQTEGPFYPDIDNDLPFVNSREERAKGDYLYVFRIVKDTQSAPGAHLGRFDLVLDLV